MEPIGQQKTRQMDERERSDAVISSYSAINKTFNSILFVNIRFDSHNITLSEMQCSGQMNCKHCKHCKA